MSLLSIHQHTRHGPILVRSKPAWHRPPLWVFAASLLLAAPFWVGSYVILTWAVDVCVQAPWPARRES